MNKLFKPIFFIMLMISSLMAISSYSWLGMWMGLEINLLCIIPLMQNKKNSLSSESSIKYFIVQAIASSMIMVVTISLMAKINLTSSVNFKSIPLMIFNSALLMKMGSAPFHFWFPEVMEGLSWMNCLIIMTWQKLAPMMILMYNIKFPLMMMMMITSAMIISSIMSMNQISMRKILAYSSINHLGWMLSMMMIEKTIWLNYFLIYSLMTTNIIMTVKITKINFINQMFMMSKKSNIIKFTFMMNFMSMSGIPPFPGFFPKWMTIQALIESNMYILPMIMIMSTLVMIYVYTRIILSTLVIQESEINWFMNMNMEKFNMAMLNFSMLTSMIMVTMIFYSL